MSKFVNHSIPLIVERFAKVHRMVSLGFIACYLFSVIDREIGESATVGSWVNEGK